MFYQKIVHVVGSGMDEFLAKPVQRHELAQVLRQWLAGETGQYLRTNLRSVRRANRPRAAFRNAACCAPCGFTVHRQHVIMAVLERPRYGSMQWSMLFWAVAITLLVLYLLLALRLMLEVVGPSSEGFRQIAWLMISLTACFCICHVRLSVWENGAWGLYALTLFFNL